MTARIINLAAWRAEHSERAGLYSELLRAYLLPLRLWLSWWGIR